MNNEKKEQRGLTERECRMIENIALSVLFLVLFLLFTKWWLLFILLPFFRMEEDKEIEEESEIDPRRYL